MPPGGWFSVFVWAWWLQVMLVPAAEAQQQQQGEDCSPKPCGNLTISDPFWLTDWKTGRSCGPLDYHVNCFIDNNNTRTPVLRSSGIYGFAILEILYEERSLRVVDQGKLELLRAQNSCHAPNWNTSEKLGAPFRVDPVNLGLVLYNCTDAAAARSNGALVETKMNCGNESQVFARTGGYEETSGYPVEGCEACVVPVLGSSSGEASASDYERLITDGFLLRWDHPPPPRK